MKQRNGHIVGLVLCILAGTLTVSAEAEEEKLFDHSLFGELLAKYVDEGWVDYKGFKNDEALLDIYLEELQNVRPKEFPNEKEQLAFWINAYNACTIKGILDNYPVKGVKWIYRFFKRKNYSVAGKKLSLNDIEHEILRKEFSEPRIHFAVVCASKSCPQLGSFAYDVKWLDLQLENAAKYFLQDDTMNRYDAGEDVLYLSSIFDWFPEDFEKASGSLVAYVKKYLPADDVGRISDKTKIKFLKYDWSLNGK